MNTATAETSAVDEFLRQGVAQEPLRVCCYGSSSSLTPQTFLDQAYQLGKLLAQRGHTCVNGAGAWGCMGHLNQGAADHDGHIVGVIHGMFQVDGAIWTEGKLSGHHKAEEFKDTGSHSAFEQNTKRELLIASGNDLQHRKKLLVQHADALVVLPGGPGTWDELLEMACAKNVGLSDVPIICINVDGYYEPLRQMFALGQKHQLIKNATDDILTFVPTALEAVQFLEQQLHGTASKCPSIQQRKRQFMESQGRTSMMGDAFGMVKSFLLGRQESSFLDQSGNESLDQSNQNIHTLEEDGDDDEQSSSSPIVEDTNEEEDKKEIAPDKENLTTDRTNTFRSESSRHMIGLSVLTFALGVVIGMGFSKRHS